MASNELPHGADPVAPVCRCHRPLSAVPGQNWHPCVDAEPGPRVQAVALLGDDPRNLRRVRVPEGWHGRGYAANHPDATPPIPWDRTGRCWAGNDHPVVDVTANVAETDRLIVIVRWTAASPSSLRSRWR